MVYGLLLVAAASRLRPRAIVEGRCRDCGRLIRLERRSQPHSTVPTSWSCAASAVNRENLAQYSKGSRSTEVNLLCGLGAALPSSVSLNGNRSG